MSSQDITTTMATSDNTPNQNMPNETNMTNENMQPQSPAPGEIQVVDAQKGD